jgi:phage N-6-adenine-methyltransferase
MTDIVKLPRGSLADFKPEQSKEKISVLNAAIQHAKEMQDWEAGWEAVDWLIDEQRKFVGWWADTVTPNRKRKFVSADRGKQTSMEEAEERTGIANQQVSRWRGQIRRPGYRDRLFKASHAKAMADGAQRRSDLQTGEMEWFTPARYIEKARHVLGTIDLDPASCAEAQETVKAARFYSLADDGLAQAWAGTVWLNPPYAGGLVAAFAKKMIDSWAGGELQAAIMLTNAYTETSWFHALVNASRAVCFTRGRIKFESPHGEKCAPTNGQSFFYFGNELDLFRQHFADVGLVMVEAP